ncbi:hypothetical protein AAY473_009912 [Plecturocebus cupreus]
MELKGARSRLRKRRPAAIPPTIRTAITSAERTSDLSTAAHSLQRTSDKHFLWTMEGPASSYSGLLIHICWKVEREARIEPPIQTEYFRSGGAMICGEQMRDRIYLNLYLETSWSAVAQLELIAALNSWTQVILPPWLSKMLGLQDLTLLPRLECSDTIMAHCSLDLWGSRMEFYHVAQAGLELPGSSDMPASGSQSSGIIGMSHCAQLPPVFYPCNMIPHYRVSLSPRLECSGVNTAHCSLYHLGSTQRSIHSAVLTPSGSKPGIQMRTHLVSRAAHDRGEDSPGGIISCEACLAQARAIVTHKRSGLLFTHGVRGRLQTTSDKFLAFGDEGEAPEPRISSSPGRTQWGGAEAGKAAAEGPGRQTSRSPEKREAPGTEREGQLKFYLEYATSGSCSVTQAEVQWQECSSLQTRPPEPKLSFHLSLPNLSLEL